MTDQFSTDKVREFIAAARATMNHEDGTYRDAKLLDELSGHIDALEAQLPAPTLADMSMEEREECRWMQADVKPGGLGDVKTWEKPAPALPGRWRLAVHRKYGRVVVTNPYPYPDDDGEVHFTFPADDLDGYAWDTCRPDDLVYIDEEGDTSDSVPESTLAVGSEWGDADALAQACRESGLEQIVVVDKRGTAGMWDMGLRCWRVTAPDANFAPYTIIHIGREDDQ